MVQQKINRNQDDKARTATTVSIGYGAAGTAIRRGDMVTFNVNTVVASYPAADGGALGEIFPLGYRPAGVANFVMSSTAGATNTRIAININENGSMSYGNFSSVGGGTRFQGNGVWFTNDPWPV